jgi:hypothetical protein
MRPVWLRIRTSVVTQFWIHQDFLKCYFISIIIYKNPKKLRKRKIQKYIFLESTASFRQNRVHQVNTGQTMSTRVKNEFRAVSGQSRHFWPKPSPPSQYGSNHVDQGKKWVSGRFGSKPLFFTKTEFTRSNHVDQDKKWVSCRCGSNLLSFGQNPVHRVYIHWKFFLYVST